MRNRKHYSIIAVLCGGLFGFTSCSDIGDAALNGQPVAVQFSTGHTAKPESRVTDAGEWETTDRIGIYMVQSGKTLAATNIVGEADNRKYLPGSETETATLSPDGTGQTIYYPASGTVDFIAYYPWVETGTSAGQINNYQYPVDLNNQKKAANYFISRDAKGKDKKAGAVTLNFSRMLSKLVMTLEASASSELTGSDLAAITPITLTAPLTANYALVDGAITSVGNNTTVSLGSVQESSGVYTVEAIVLPGTGTGRKVAFTLPESAGGGTLTWNIPSERDFAPGTQYKCNLTLDRTGVKAGTFTIEDWTGVDDDPTESDPDFVPESWSDPNCYIISTDGGSVTIPVRKAYDMWRYHPFFKTSTLKDNLSGELTAELVWMDNQDLIDTDDPNSIALTGDDYYAQITVQTAANQTGNAVVAVKIGGEIRWSWHLWVTGEDVTATTCNYNNGERDYTFMDRNLGAINATVGDVGSKGLYYQWGRKDPFVGG